MRYIPSPATVQVGTIANPANEVTIVAAAGPMEDTTWLAFGVWLTETEAADDRRPTNNTYAFGAFADGGGRGRCRRQHREVTGDATYQGQGRGRAFDGWTAVDFFHADATLNAKFGDGTAEGTITGMIHNIMAAGRPVGDSIELVVVDPGATDPDATDNIDADGSFDGRARMGNTGEQDSSGEDIYRYTGTWTGNFYNHMADDRGYDRRHGEHQGAGFGCRHLRRRPGGQRGNHGCGRDRELRGRVRCALHRQQLQSPRLVLEQRNDQGGLRAALFLVCRA